MEAAKRTQSRNQMKKSPKIKLFAAWCKCADANHFSAFQVADVRDLRNQLHGAPGKEIDTFLLAISQDFQRDSFSGGWVAQENKIK